jgi:exopolyphosphatase/guanosine-5'-triphosphate,3'-diphosphate pyrophosphatase
MARVAAVDCGTNSIRLLVADVVTGSAMRDVHREMRVVRLGQGVDATGVLASEAIERTRVALADYTTIMRRRGVERVRMVATSATRDAANRDDFFSMVRATLGAEAEVISGDEEARLSFDGAVGELDPDDGPFVVVDVGGGSTEVVVGELTDSGPVVRAARSVDIGCVRLTERCLPDDPPTPEQVEKARAVTAEILAGAFAAVPVEGPRTWVGVAGTVTTLSALALGLPQYDPDVIHLSRLSLPDLHRVAADLLAMPRAERAALGPMHPGRVDVIGGGAIVVEELAHELHARAGITELVVSEHDILDGIARSLA